VCVCGVCVCGVCVCGVCVCVCMCGVWVCVVCVCVTNNHCTVSVPYRPTSNWDELSSKLLSGYVVKDTTIYV